MKEEQRRMKKLLNELQQEDNESIRLYGAKWEYQHSLLLESMDTEQQIQMFIQSLARTELRLSLLGSKLLFTPASKGTVEMFMKTLRRLILTYTNQQQMIQQWHRHLRLVQFIYNTTTNETTSQSPYYLTHGRHPRTPLVITKPGAMVDCYHSDQQQFALGLQERINSAYDAIDEISATHHLRHTNPFKEDDQILIFNQAKTSSGKPRKLQFDWFGPMPIISNYVRYQGFKQQQGNQERAYLKDQEIQPSVV